MKESFLKITQTGERSRVELECDNWELAHFICEELHCDLFESVPTSEPAGYLLLVDDNGRFVPGNRANLIAGYYYGDVVHGIVGDALIGKEGYRNGEPDIVGLDEEDFCKLDDVLHTNEGVWREFLPLVREYAQYRVTHSRIAENAKPVYFQFRGNQNGNK